MSLFKSTRSTDVKELLESIAYSSTALVNKDTAANISNETELAVLCESVKSLMTERYSNLFPEEISERTINEDAELVATLISNGISEINESNKNIMGPMNENATVSFTSLSSCIATTIRRPYEANIHRLFDTEAVERPTITIEEVIPTVKNTLGVETAIVDAFSPFKRTGLFVDETEIYLQKLINGIEVNNPLVPSKNINLLEGLNTLYTVDRSVKLTGVDAVDKDDDTVTIDKANIKLAKGSNPFFDNKTNNLNVIFEITNADTTVSLCQVSAKLNFQTGVMEFVSADIQITKVYFEGIVSHAEHTHPISIGFQNGFNEYPIATRPHIEVSVPTETRTDVKNQINYFEGLDILTKMTDQISIVSSRLEDERLRKVIYNNDYTYDCYFDFNAPSNFAYGNLEWFKREFIPVLDQQALALKQQYNIEDCHFRVGVSPFILRILDADYTQTKGASETQKGSGAINYTVSVKTATSTFYFISSLALEQNELTMLLIPNTFKDSQVKTYKYFKYSAFMTDQIRRHDNPVMPATVYSERNLEMVFTPLSALVTINGMAIKNTSGSYYIKERVAP